LVSQVSVVIPTRNRKDLVVRAVACALAQVDVQPDVIVVDDGSTDGTSSALRESFGERVRIVRNARSTGVGAARNAGIREASATWVAFLDDDDVWAPDKLASQVREAKRTGRVWTYAGMVTVDSQLRIMHGVRPDPPERIARDILIRNRLPSGPSNVLVRRDALATAGGFDASLRYHEDWDLWIRLAQVGPPAAVVRPLLAHVVHGSNTPVDTILHDLAVIERRYATLRGRRRVDRAEVYRWIAGSHLVAGARWPAARAYLRALLASPLRSTRLAALAVASPGIGAGSAYRRPPDVQWESEAEAWLAPLRRAMVSTAGA
jgi:glycosyltransferase involved in cell wall biosynthesis